MRQRGVFPCPCCRRLTRPCKSKVADYPGTVQRYKGMCNTCYVNGNEDILPPVISIEQARSALTYWLHARGRADNELNQLHRSTAA